jgi:hypothetical protein
VPGREVPAFIRRRCRPGIVAARDLEPVTTMTQGPAVSPVAAEPMSWPDAIEVDRVVPPPGNMTIGPQQFWLGTSRAGQSVSFWIDTTTVHT